MPDETGPRLAVEIIDQIPISTCGITDLIYLQDENNYFILTLAIDQRILVFQLEEKLEYKTGLMTHVTDPASFLIKTSNINGEKELVVAGNGMETIPLPRFS